jgi:hypothetical protein
MLKIHGFYPFFLDSTVLVDCFNLINIDFMVFVRGLDPLDLNLMFLLMVLMFMFSISVPTIHNFDSLVFYSMDSIDGFDAHVFYDREQ